jgi:hypothetical protein
VPLVLWLGHYLALEIAHEMNWPPELWTGTLFMTTLVSLLLSVVMVPMRNPITGGGER